MDTRRNCPDRSLLSALLNGTLSGDEQARIIQHLDNCEACRGELEQLVPGGSDLLGVASVSRRPEDAGDDSELMRAIDRLKRGDEASPPAGNIDEDELSLDFLMPSDHPGHLGRLGAYDITQVVGRGGMGVVLKGFDAQLNRFVAIKVLTPQLASDATARKRFRREGQAAAAVSHDHVVTIHAVNEERGIPYLVMEFISGQSLQQRIDRDGPLELKEILRIGMQAANGLAAAHAQGLVHRDVKPANILLENGVERVKITDFGLARAVDDVRVTRSGVVAGTPQYMSPEQAQGARLNHRADLFSLGGVLYAMCTGRPPFRADNTLAMIRSVCEQPPRPIQQINAEIPDWLVSLIDRLMAKVPDERFDSASEVAELLAAYLAHVQEPTDAPVPLLPAKPLATKPRNRRSIRRRAWIGVAATILLLAATLGLSDANGVTDVAGTVIRIIRGDGTLVVEVDDPDVEVLIDGEEIVFTGAGAKAVRLRPGQHELSANKNGQQIQQELFAITRGAKRAVRVSLSGETAAVGTRHEALDAKTNRGVVLKRIWEGPHVDLRGSVSRDGRFLSFVDWESGDLALRDLVSGTARRLTNKGSWSVSSTFALESIFSPDGKQLAYGWFTDREDAFFELRVIRVDDGQDRTLYQPSDAMYVQPMDWSSDGRSILMLLMKSDRSFRIELLSVADGSARILKSLNWSDARVRFSPDGRHVAYDHVESDESPRRDITLLNVEDGHENVVIRHPADDRLLGWTTDGNGLLFSSDRGGSVDAWLIPLDNGMACDAPKRVKADLGKVKPLGISENGSCYFGVRIGGVDVYIAAIDDGIAGPAVKAQLASRRFEGTNSRPGWSHDGRYLAFVSQRRVGSVLCVLSTETGQQQEFPLLTGVAYYSSGVSWSPDGRFVLLEQSYKDTPGVYRVDTASGQVAALLINRPGERVYQPQVSPDDQSMYFVRADDGRHRIVKRDLSTGKEIELHSRPPYVNSLALSRDGQKLAFVAGDALKTPKSLYVMPVAGGAPVEVLRLKPSEGGNSLAWCPDGKHLLIVRTGDNEALTFNQLWQIALHDGQPLQLPVSMPRMFSLSVHPDGQRIAFNAGTPFKNEVWEMKDFIPEESNR